MCQSLKRHHAADVGIHVYIRINVSEEDGKDKLYHKIPVVTTAIIRNMLLLIRI